MRALRPILLVLFLSACVSRGPTAPSPTSYDFGTAAAPLVVEHPLHGLLAVGRVLAPEWLSGEGIVYRLAYETPDRPSTYSLSRWVAPPPELFSHRLQQRLAQVAAGGVVRQSSGLDADHVLRVELEEFGQVFDAPHESRAVVRVRATVLGKRGAFVTSELFTGERPTRPDAAGAVVGLREATDEVIDHIGHWLVKELERR